MAHVLYTSVNDTLALHCIILTGERKIVIFEAFIDASIDHKTLTCVKENLK